MSERDIFMFMVGEGTSNCSRSIEIEVIEKIFVFVVRILPGYMQSLNDINIRPSLAQS